MALVQQDDGGWVGVDEDPVNTGAGGTLAEVADPGGLGAEFGNLTDGFFAPDPRDTYTNPDPTATRVGTTPTGNPIWQLFDVFGDLLQWNVNEQGGVSDLTNISQQTRDAQAEFGPSGLGNQGTSTVTPPPPSSASSGNSAIGLLNSLLNGDSNTNQSGTPVSIITNTNAPNNSIVSFFQDTSQRNTTSNTTNFSSVSNANSASLVSDIAKAIGGLFQTAPTPGPQNFAAGQTTDPKQNLPTAGSTDVATVDGLATGTQSLKANALLKYSLIAAVVLIVISFAFRRR